MTKEEFENYLISIGGLVRTYREYKGPIVEAGWFQIDEGWYEMVKNLIDELITIGWDKKISQVKEKFGGLRFYLDEYSEGSLFIISKYESLSYKTCEKCGKEGVLRKGSWLKTLCDEHSEGREQLIIKK